MKKPTDILVALAVDYYTSLATLRIARSQPTGFLFKSFPAKYGGVQTGVIKVTPELKAVLIQELNNTFRIVSYEVTESPDGLELKAGSSRIVTVYDLTLR